MNVKYYKKYRKLIFTLLKISLQRFIKTDTTHCAKTQLAPVQPTYTVAYTLKMTSNLP